MILTFAMWIILVVPSHLIEKIYWWLLSQCLILDKFTSLGLRVFILTCIFRITWHCRNERKAWKRWKDVILEQHHMNYSNDFSVHLRMCNFKSKVIDTFCMTFWLQIYFIILMTGMPDALFWINTNAITLLFETFIYYV